MDGSVLSALARCGIFGSLDPRLLERALDGLPHQVKCYGKGAIIHFQGDAYSSLFVLLKGQIDATMRDYDGRTLRIERLKGPDLLAPGILFADDNALPVTLTAASGVELLVMPRSSIVGAGRRYPDFLVALLRDGGNRIVTLAEKLRLSQFTTLRQKVASYLLECAQKQRTETVQLEHSKEALAELFGAARPSVSRTFSELRDEGLIQPDGKTVYILSVEGLTRIVNRR